MHALLILVALAADPTATAGPAETYAAVPAAAAALRPELQTGTLLFSAGDCLAVKTFTLSRYTHVAIVALDGETPWIYDSQNGVGVRRLSLEDYLTATLPDDLHVAAPATAYSPAATVALRAHLEAQLGRPYSVLHYLTGNRHEGLHCAEYVTDALMAAELVTAQRPAGVSPASLRAGLLRHDLYRPTRTLAVLIPQPQREPGRNWCHELWLDTKDCCAGAWSGVQRSVACQ